MERLASDEKQTVFARMTAERLRTEVGPKRDAVNVMEDAQEAFDKAWEVVGDRPFMCNAKQLIRGA